MSFFVEREQFGESVDAHLGHVYEHMFPHCRWDTLPKIGIRGILRFIPPIMTNSESIGYDYKYISGRDEGPFTVRYDIPQPTDKIAMDFILSDVMLVPSSTVDPKKTLRFEPYMKEGDRFGGIALATIGVLRLPFWPITDPPGRKDFYQVHMSVMGIENNNKPSALLYFE